MAFLALSKQTGRSGKLAEFGFFVPRDEPVFFRLAVFADVELAGDGSVGEAGGDFQSRALAGVFHGVAFRVFVALDDRDFGEVVVEVSGLERARRGIAAVAGLLLEIVREFMEVGPGHGLGRGFFGSGFGDKRRAVDFDGWRDEARAFFDVGYEIGVVAQQF